MRELLTSVVQIKKHGCSQNMIHSLIDFKYLYGTLNHL